MHQQSRRKRKATSSGADADENAPGPIQSKIRKKSPKTETKTDRRTGSRGHQTSLQRGKNDTMFGHYWWRLETEVKEGMQSGAPTSFSRIVESSSSDEEVSSETSSFQKAEDIEYKKNEAECAIATPSASSSAETYSKYMNVPEQNIECKIGVPFRHHQAEPQGIHRELLTSSKFLFASKDPLQGEPHNLTVKKKNSDQHISTPNTETKCSESTDVYKIQFSKDLKQKKRTILGESETKIDICRSLLCGTCNADFGQRPTVLGKLIFKDKVENTDGCSFKCLYCSKVVKSINLYNHIITHFKKDKLFCRKCQIDSEYGNGIYDLETPDISKQINASLEMQKIGNETKIPKLEPQVARALSEISVCCGECKNSFGDVSNKLQRMYQCSEDRQSSAVYCCIICGKTRKLKSIIDKDLLTHFQSKEVCCQTCYNKAPSQRIPEIKFKDIVPNKSKERLRVFDPSIAIVCNKCWNFLANFAVLDPPPLIRYVKTIEDDNLKISANLLYKCLICCCSFEVSDIKIHIEDHINSGHLACRKCFAEDQKSIASLERITYRSAPSDGSFSEEDLQSRCVKYILRTGFSKHEKKNLFLQSL